MVVLTCGAIAATTVKTFEWRNACIFCWKGRTLPSGFANTYESVQLRTIKYIQKRTNTYKYVQIFTNTYKYVRYVQMSLQARCFDQHAVLTSTRFWPARGFDQHAVLTGTWFWRRIRHIHKIRTNTYKYVQYVQINTNTYKYLQIRPNTYDTRKCFYNHWVLCVSSGRRTRSSSTKNKAFRRRLAPCSTQCKLWLSDSVK